MPLKLKRLCSDKVKYGVFRNSRASNSDMNSLIWLKCKFIRDSMAVLVTCKFEDGLIKSGNAILRTTFSLCLGKSCRSRVSNSKVNSPIWPEIKLVRDFYGCSCYLQVWRSDQKWSCYPLDNIFPIISLRELSVDVETSFDPFCPKTLCCLSTTQTMLHIKLGNWPKRYSSLKVWTTDDDNGGTIGTLKVHLVSL